MSSWLRRRFTYYENLFEACPNDDDPGVLLRGYRSRPDLRGPKDGSDYENMDLIDQRLASCSMDGSLTMSEDSMGTLTEREGSSAGDSREGTVTPIDHRFSGTRIFCDSREGTVTPSMAAPVMTYTPVLRRRRSSHTKRNYRILAPSESLLVLQQQAPVTESEKRKLLRRRSSRKENIVVGPPMVITPPVLLTRTQSCLLCSRDRNSLLDEMTPTTLKAPRMSEEETARLSFVSSSTGYSSARSSLRSSDGGDSEEKERNRDNRDSGIGGCSLSLPSSRLSDVILREELVIRPRPLRGSSQLDRIAGELLDTERAYVHDLHDVIKGYLNLLVSRRDALHITLDDISSLFGCIERISAFNGRLLQRLEAAGMDCVRMCQCFVDCSGKYEDYIIYCTNYHRMLSTLSSLILQPSIAAALSEQQQALGHALPLSAYLLKPVQRILKYHLFIENMLKNLPSTASPEDVAVVKKAHEVMTSQAGRINDEKKRAEHSDRVTQLQSAIQKWTVDKTTNLCAYGDLLLEASFRQAGAGSKTTRLLFLFEEMLLIVKQRNSNYVCKDYIMCSNLMLNESICAEDPLAFQVLSFDNPRTQYIFLASSMEQKRQWMTELKRMMLDHYAIEIPEKTKQLMLAMDNTQRVAFGRPEFAEVSMKNHKKIPKYLEKRRKSVEQASQETRRRSLSASRLLGASKTSLVSDSTTRFVVNAAEKDKELPLCTCHHAGVSQEKTSQLPPQPRPPVSRTLSASTIDFGGIPPLEMEEKERPRDDVMSSRSRFHQARNRRHLPPKQEASRSTSNRRLEENEIAATFDELYQELVAYGNEQIKQNPPPSEPPSPERAQRRLDALVLRSDTLTWRGDTMIPRSLRSKSLTRLDDVTIHKETEMPPVEMRPVERRFSKLEQLKKCKARKYTIDELVPLRLSHGRLSLSDKTTHISDGLPPVDNRTQEENRTMSARQRTPLTAEQAAELDSMLPSCGVVKSMIRQLEHKT